MWFLCVFYHRLLDYRRPEVEALAELFGAFGGGGGGGNGGGEGGGGGGWEANPRKWSLEWKLPENHHVDSPFHFVSLPSEEIARNIANRSILVKGIYELWGQGINYEELEKAVREFPDERKLPYLTPESTFRIVVDSFGKVISFEEQNERIQGLRRVDLKNPEHKFWLIETDDYGANNGLPPVVQRTVFFGREVGQLIGSFCLHISLRAVNTWAHGHGRGNALSWPIRLAQKGKLVYDPLLALEYSRCCCTFWSDDDGLCAMAWPDCNVWSNFKQYNLPSPISLLRADNNLPPWRPGLKEVFDAIICDPPYGVRAGGRKSGGRKLLKGAVGPYTVPEEKRFDHIPSTAPYSLAECVHDLLDLSARMLVMGGRLVFFYPVVREDGVTNNTQFPEHPCFTLIASCEQILSFRYSRILLTMVKTGLYTAEIEESAKKQHLEFKENHLKWLEDGNLHSAASYPIIRFHVPRKE
ncbi:tRNA (guanine(10)-N2)-methyltransferase [Ananas comosus]|uniref:tRNA (Guanine(10)-N2)-methyltransferase n=1 Tax=Ananas comosus TaxID=4615 RepID=A0A199UYZ3_ANACO|nr:tRNA (guanine(10)-N2)-methyltransferase [Ananas comosus]